MLKTPEPPSPHFVPLLLSCFPPSSLTPSLPSGHYSCIWPPQELPGQPGEEDGGQAGAGHHRLQVRADQEEALPLRLHLQLGAAAGSRYTRNFDFPNDQADARIESTKCNSF